MSRRRDSEDDGRPPRVRLVEGRQRPYAAVAATGSFGALLQDKLLVTATKQIQEFKTKTRGLYKHKASLAALQAEVAAGRIPSSIGPGALRTRAHTGFADLDTAAEAEAAAEYRELLQRITARYIEQREAGITRLTDELKHIKTVSAPAALTDTFNSLVAGSAHAQDPSVLEVLTEFKKLLEIDMSAVDNQLRDGNALRESTLLAAVERRTQQQLQRQQRQQTFGVTAEALAAAAAAAGAAAVTSAIANPAAAGAAPAGDTHMADEGAAPGEDGGEAAVATQPLPLNQEQLQQQRQEAQAAANASMTPQQLAAAVQAGINASIGHLLQHGLMPQPPTTPPQPRPRNRQPGGNGRQNRPQQQQQPRNRPHQPQQQQQRNRPRSGQQQQPRRSPNGPVPRQQNQPRQNPPQQRRQQQQQQRRRPNGAAGRTNANDGFRRTGNGGNRGRQARQPSH